MADKFLLTSTFIIVTHVMLYGQSAHSPNVSVIPPSPTASALGKYADIPVSLNTGIPQIGIPIYTIQSNDLQIPVSLSYHAGGIKVEEVASYAGLGWSLMAGGMISRTVKGKPDEQPNVGYLYTHDLLPQDHLLSNYVEEEYSMMVNIAYWKSMDSEPDEFYYNFNGHSGKFVLAGIDDEGFVIPQLIPYAGIQILAGAGLGSFEAITEDGTRYIFGRYESAYIINPDFDPSAFPPPVEQTSHQSTCCGDESVTPSFPSGWLLTTIISKSGEVINCEYEIYTESYWSGISETHQKPNLGTVLCAENTCDCISYIDVLGYRLKAIRSRNCIVEFTNDLPRVDLPGSNALRKISINSIERNNSTNDVDKHYIKGYHLDYDYYEGAGNTNLPDAEKRLRLLSVTEESSTGLQLPPTNLIYNETPIAVRSSKGQDYWGYNNGKHSNTSLIPKDDDECFLFPDIRSTVPEFTMAGILTEIQYPTGGSHRFEFEVNDYSENSTGGQILEPVKEITSAQVYVATDGVTSANVDFVIDHSQYVEITVTYTTPCNCDITYFIKNTGNNQEVTANSGVNCSYLTAGNYSIYAEIAGNEIFHHYVSVKVNYKQYTGTMLKTKPASGLRIKSIIASASSGVSDTADQIINYRYQLTSEEERSSGVLISRLKMEYPSTTFWIDDFGFKYACYLLNKSSHSHASISTVNGSPVAYREVKVIRGKISEGSVPENGENGYTIHKFSFVPNSGDFIFPFATPISPDWKRGLELEQIHFNKNNTLVARTTNSWEDDDQQNNYAEVWGIKVSQNQFDPSTGPEFFNGAPQNLFAAEGYVYVSQWVRLSQSTTETYYADGSVHTTSISYYYDNSAHTQLTRTVSTRSDGTTEVTVRRFPLDYTVPGYSGTDNMLISLDKMTGARHMLNTVIEEYTFVIKNNSTIKSSAANNAIGNSTTILNGGTINFNANESLIGSNGSKGFAEQDTFIVSGTLTRFRIESNNVVPDTVFVLDLKDPLPKSVFKVSHILNDVFCRDNHYRPIRKYDAFDAWAKPVQFHEPYGKLTSIIYEDNSGQAGAVYENASITDVAYTGFENDNQGGFSYALSNVGIENNTGPVSRTVAGNQYHKPGTISRFVAVDGKYVLSFWSKQQVALTGSQFNMLSVITGETLHGFTFYQYLIFFNAAGSITITCAGELDELRFYPYSALATTYSYSPLAGVSEICDENNYISHYEYDDFNRVHFQEDHFGNGLNYTEYHYRNPYNNDDRNYIRTETAIQPALTKSSLASATLSNKLSKRSLSFIDGLARPVQQLDVMQSPSEKDIVNHIEYDAAGRQTRKYLPYTTSQSPGEFKPDAFSEQQNFYLTGTICENTDYPFQETAFEKAPTARVIRKAHAGDAWKPGSHNIQFNYRANYENEVRMFKPDLSINGWKGVTFFPKGALTVVETADENGNAIIAFQDHKGRTVLEKHPKSIVNGNEQKQFNFTFTYYLYDDLDRLRVVITPAGYNQLLANGSFSVCQTNDIWNFFYEYNDRGLISAKKIPGIDWSYFLYDQLNRAVLIQDPKLRTSDKWKFQKFDELGRTVISGLATISGQTAQQLQDELWQAGVQCSEYRSATSLGYSNVVFPTTALEYLTLNYYDDYDFNCDGTADYVSAGNEAARAKNKQTGLFSNVLGSLPAIFEKSVSFYDYQGRVIETKRSNHKGQEESELTAYNFQGLPLEQSRMHHYSYTPPGGGLGYSADLLRKVRHEYDHSGRIKNTWIQVDELPEIWIHSFSYNELGQLQKYKLHNQLKGSGAIPVQKSMQTIDFRYNVRGWLTGINELSTVKEDGDFWGMELHYDENSSLVESEAQFNGNIAWMAWKSLRDESTRLYGYTYDPLNRLVKAAYGTILGPGITEADQYTVDNLLYDDAGNISAMRVFGARTYSDQTKLYEYGITDELSYQYYGHQLIAVDDAAQGVTWNASPDFKDVINAADYVYDVSGNMISDANKSINITYNHLNLPSIIQKANDQLKVTYSANGIKLKEETTENLHTQTTDYFGDIIHEEGKPKRILFDGGYLLNDTLGNWIPYYFIKDHLGNVRVVFKGEDIQWQQSKLTFEINADEEGDTFPKFKQVSVVRNNEAAMQGVSSGKLFYEQGPSTDVPVKKGDTLQVSVYYYYPEQNPEKSAPPVPVKPRPASAALSLELKPMPAQSSGNDLGTRGNRQVYGIQLSIGGLLSKLSRKKASPEETFPDNQFDEVPQAYLELSLRDTNDNEISQWRLYVDTANSWSRLTDSIGFQVPDTLQQYMLRASLHNESEREIWFDTLSLNLGTKADPVIQVNHYYPYGNLIADISWQLENSDTNDYLYNGKQLQRSLNLNWLDYGARWYDPQVGRWWVVDPMAENGRSWSPYNYAFDNAIRFIDPDGRWPGPAIGVQMGQLIGSLSYKAHNVAGNITEVANYEAQTDKSMPIVKASQEGLVGTKVLSDFSKLVNPVVDNTAAFIQFKTGLTIPHDMGELEAGFEASENGSKVFLTGRTKNGPEVNLELGAYESSQGQLKGYLSVNDENLIGQRPEERDWEMSAKLGPISGVNIGINANPTTILNTYNSDNFKDRMQNIQQSYSLFTK